MISESLRHKSFSDTTLLLLVCDNSEALNTPHWALNLCVTSTVSIPPIGIGKAIQGIVLWWCGVSNRGIETANSWIRYKTAESWYKCHNQWVYVHYRSDKLYIGCGCKSVVCWGLQKSSLPLESTFMSTSAFCTQLVFSQKLGPKPINWADCEVL